MARADGDVEIPRWCWAGAALAVAAGVAQGLLRATSGPAERLLWCMYAACAYLYLALSLIDFLEHLRLEKVATGRYTSMTAIPIGETVNHVCTVATLVAALALARRLPATLQPRDYFVLAAPALFLVLGLRDELVYHRRRCAHREDIMHTTAHLTAGAVWTTLYALRLGNWG